MYHHVLLFDNINKRIHLNTYRHLYSVQEEVQDYVNIYNLQRSNPDMSMIHVIIPQSKIIDYYTGVKYSVLIFDSPFDRDKLNIYYYGDELIITEFTKEEENELYMH